VGGRERGLVTGKQRGNEKRIEGRKRGRLAFTARQTRGPTLCFLNEEKHPHANPRVRKGGEGRTQKNNCPFHDLNPGNRISSSF